MQRKTWFAGIAALACAAALARGGQGTADEPPRVVVGTFDSRAIAIAYVQSDGFQAFLAGKHAELARAREAGDAAQVAALEAFGPQLQERLHRQGFAAAPVDEIVARIADDLPRIAERRGVDVIVSKWALAYRRPGAKLVDVTDDLAACFEPSEKTWKSIHEIVRQDPVPLEQLEQQPH